MTTPHAISALGMTSQQYDERMSRAKAEAVHLRREAIDAFVGTLVDAVRSAIGGWRRRSRIAAVATRQSAPCQR
jgi:hypothetical protein